MQTSKKLKRSFSIEETVPQSLVSLADKDEPALNIIQELHDRGFMHILHRIFNQLNPRDLEIATLVWTDAIIKSSSWKILMQHYYNNSVLFRTILIRRRWAKNLFRASDPTIDGLAYHGLYHDVMRVILNLDTAWRAKQFAIREIIPDSGRICCIHFDDSYIAMGMDNCIIRVYDKYSLGLMKFLEGHSGPVLCLKLHESVLFSGSTDGTIRVWNTDNWQLINVLDHHTSSVTCLTVDRSKMYTCSTDGSVVLWNVYSPGAAYVTKILTGHSYSIVYLVANDCYVCCGTDIGVIYVWNPNVSDTVLITFDSHEGPILSMQLMGSALLSSSRDGSVRFWNLYFKTSTVTHNISTPNVHCIFLAMYDSERTDNRMLSIVDAFSSRPIFYEEKVKAYGVILCRSDVTSVQMDDTIVVLGSLDNVVNVYDYLART